MRNKAGVKITALLLSALLYVSAAFPALALPAVGAVDITELPMIADTPSAAAPDTEDEASEEVSADTLAQDTQTLSDLQQNLSLSTQEKLNSLFAKYDTLGACVCIIKNGKIAYTFCYGSIAPDGDAITTDTLFRVGSISKMITGIGMMQLVENGVAGLEDDVSDLLGVTVRNPHFPSVAVTLRQLMTHTAGLRDSGFYNLALEGKITPLDALFATGKRSYQFYSTFRPGTRVKYSNFGGGLLGSIIEAQTGQTLDAYMKDHVFTPLQITAAYQGALLPQSAAVADMYAMPSRKLQATVREGEASQVCDPMTDYTLSAGKLTLSAPDLAKLLIVLSEGGAYGQTSILQQSTVNDIRTVQNGIGSVTCKSGRGLEMNIITDTIVQGRTLYGHGGKANGMLCAAYFDPSDRTGVVMLTNGCNNRRSYQGVGLLSVMTIRLCYAELLDNQLEADNPWLVTE